MCFTLQAIFYYRPTIWCVSFLSLDMCDDSPKQCLPCIAVEDVKFNEGGLGPFLSFEAVA